MRTLFSVACCALLAASSLAAESAQKAFDRLKKLEGTWTGKAGDTELKVIYKVTGAGSALVETQFPGSPHEMVTVYHMDGNKLLLTHYCAAQNQPRMKYAPGKDANVIQFTFAGATNLKAGAMCMRSVRYRLLSPDHIVSEWTAYSGNKKAATEKFDLTRVKS